MLTPLNERMVRRVQSLHRTGRLQRAVHGVERETIRGNTRTYKSQPLCPRLSCEHLVPAQWLPLLCRFSTMTCVQSSIPYEITAMKCRRLKVVHSSNWSWPWLLQESYGWRPSSRLTCERQNDSGDPTSVMVSPVRG